MVGRARRLCVAASQRDANHARGARRADALLPGMNGLHVRGFNAR